MPAGQPAPGPALGRRPLGRSDTGRARAALVLGVSVLCLLLVAGVAQVSGRFERGDAVEVADETGGILGQGLTRYDALDAERIKRLRSDQIETVLGYPARGPLIHRDDMAI